MKSAVIRWVQLKRRLVAQLLFTVFAFIAMACFSFVLCRGIISGNLLRNSENIIAFTKAQVEADLLWPKTTLYGLSETARQMILNGGDPAALRAYLRDASEYIEKYNAPNLTYSDLFIYLEPPGGTPVFINAAGDPPGGFRPKEYPWYEYADASPGDVAETPVYDNVFGDKVVGYTDCIYDGEGRRTGIIGLEMKVDVIGRYVVETALSNEGHGMLFDRNLNVLAHPNSDFVGRNPRTDSLPFSVFVNEMLAGEDVTEGRIKDYRGDVSVAFMRKLSNGWFIGIVAPEGPYYQPVTSMTAILFILAVSFAAVLCFILIRIDAVNNKAERQIAEANEFTRAILEYSPIGFTVADMDNGLRLLDCSDSLLKQFETTKQYYLDHFGEFSPAFQPDGSNSIEKVEKMVGDAKNGENVVDEWVHLSSAGEIIPCELTMKPIKYHGKQAVLAYIYDMRNTKKLTESLAESLEQQKVMTDISNGFIESGDSEKLVGEALAKLGKFQGVSFVLIFRVDYERAAVDMPYWWSVSGEEPERADFNLFEFIKASFFQILPEGAVTQIVSCEDIAAGPKEYHPMLDVGINAFVCVPLYVESRLWGILSVEQEYGPRVWTDSEKEFIIMAASTISGAIMRDVYEKRLEEAFRAATAASVAKGEFLSNMSHEMRTPLNAIIGMTAVGKKAGNTERKDYALDKIGDASAHLLGVINDVLDMAKIEANKLELSPVEFSFERMLQKIVTVINFKVDEKQQVFAVHIDKKAPRFVIGDDQRLSQVIMNLLSNAVKFTPEQGKISLGVYLESETDGVCKLRVEVTDTGIGVSPEQQARLFHAFGQAESGTSREYGGTGLGLTISKQIVELMDGDIWLKSEIGKGSSFIFTVKVLRSDKDVNSLLPPGVKWETMRILVVDDDKDILDFFTNLADSIGVKCDVAADGHEACSILKERGGYDMYFIDLRMPGIDGIELAAKIKEQESGKPHVVVMISAVDWSDIRDAATQAGVDKYLVKPLFSSTIIDCINECLGVTDYGEQDLGEGVSGEFAGKRMLLAEDIEVNREIVISLLENTGLEIECAENGIEALNMVKAAPGRYNVVLMDVQMPQMDGLEATRQIRSLPGVRSGRLPIIAMTANVFRHDIDACLEAGMNGHIGKPLDMDEVYGTLRQYLLDAPKNGRS